MDKILEAYLNQLNRGGSVIPSQGNTAQNELANKPRYDIDGQRYGNTLSDDMFAIKNPSLPDRHTPQSYEYVSKTPLSLEEPKTYNPVMDQLRNYDNAVKAISNYIASQVPMNEREGRKKVIGQTPMDYLGVEVYDDYWPEGESDEEMALVNYLQARDRQSAIDDLRNYGSGAHDKTAFTDKQGFPVPYHETSGNTLSDDVKYIKSGGKTYHSLGDMSPESFNPYEALSPAQLENLGWAWAPDILEGETVQDVLAAYQRILREHPERIAERRERVGFK